MASILFKVVKICNSQFKYNYLKNTKHFLNFLFHFCNLHQILNIWKKGMIAIANVFTKLQTVKILVRPLSKKCLFRTRFESQHVEASRIPAKSPWERFCHVFSSFSGKVILQMSHLVLVKVSQILGKSRRECFCHVFSSSSRIFIWEMSPQVVGEILGVSVNTMIADDKYLVQDYENSQLLIQMQLCEKGKKFSQFFVPFLKSTDIFKHFEGNDIHLR